MKRYKLIARSNIINPHTKQLHDDAGLFALDGYVESRICEVDDDFDIEDLTEKLLTEFKEANPNMRIDCIEFKEISED